MQIHITGANGFLGRQFVKAGCLPLKVDVLDINSINREISRHKPNFVLHLAGKSDPDYCEKHPVTSSGININGTLHVIDICAERRIPIVVLSSSQIWGGSWWESLWNRHAENSRLTPAVNMYGMQKISAEALTLNYGYNWAKIIRASFIFNRERLGAEIAGLKKGEVIDAPTFIKRSFIHADHFVELVNEYFRQFYQMPSVLHLAGSQTVSYYEFWSEIARQYGIDRKLVQPRRIEKNDSAKRPHNGGLDVRLSQELGFRSYDYVQGIGRMKDES